MPFISAPRSVFGPVALLAALTLAGCGKDDSPASSPATSPAASTPVLLDTKTVAGAIKQSIREQRKMRAKVTCPDTVPQAKGQDFVCLAKTKLGTTKFAVQQTDDAGNVTYAAAK